MLAHTVAGVGSTLLLDVESCTGQIRCAEASIVESNGTAHVGHCHSQVRIQYLPIYLFMDCINGTAHVGHCHSQVGILYLPIYFSLSICINGTAHVEHCHSQVGILYLFINESSYLSSVYLYLDCINGTALLGYCHSQIEIQYLSLDLQ